MKKLLACAVFLVLAACVAPRAPQDATTPVPAAEAAPNASPPATQTAASDAPAACAARNGAIRPICRMQRMTCVIGYRDAGRACSGDTDCEGKCLLKDDPPTDPNGHVTGQCQANSDPCGCRSEVNGGKVTTTICVD